MDTLAYRHARARTAAIDATTTTTARTRKRGDREEEVAVKK